MRNSPKRSFGRGEPSIFLKEVDGMVRLPVQGEIEDVLRKLENGFELDDREIWVYKEFL